MSSYWSKCNTDNHYRVAALGQTVRWHKDALLPFLAALKLARKTEYGKWLTSRKELWDVQTYACRDIRGSDDHSEHAHPVALDVRPSANPMREDGILTTDFDKFGVDDGAAFVNAFLACGFSSGIAYYTDAALTRGYLEKNGQRIRPKGKRVDPMHFQFVRGPEWIEANRERLEDILEGTVGSSWYAIIIRRMTGKAIAHCENVDALAYAVKKIGRSMGDFYVDFDVPRGQ